MFIAYPPALLLHPCLTWRSDPANSSKLPDVGDVFSRVIIHQVSSKTGEFLQWLCFMFKAGLGKPLERVWRKNTVVLGARAGCSAVSLCKKVIQQTNKQSRLPEGENCLFLKLFLNEQKKILWFRNSAP